MLRLLGIIYVTSCPRIDIIVFQRRIVLTSVQFYFCVVTHCNLTKFQVTSVIPSDVHRRVGQQLETSIYKLPECFTRWQHTTVIMYPYISAACINLLRVNYFTTQHTNNAVGIIHTTSKV